jgi:hypothetical protein
VGVPHGQKHREANSERDEAANDFVEVAEVFWNFERDHEKSQCEAEYHIAKSVDTRQSSSAYAEAIFDGKMIWSVHAKSPKLV